MNSSIATLAVALGLLSVGCQPAPPPVDAGRVAIREALRAAWRAYTLQSPSEGATSPVAMSQAASAASETRFNFEGEARFASLDSVIATISAEGYAERRYLRETLVGLASTLRDRHNAQVSLLRAMRSQEAGAHVDEETGMAMLKATSVADGIAERTILRLAAWERRFLRENYLADAYEGRLLAQVESTRANGTPDSELLHRPEIEGRIAWADSAVVAGRNLSTTLRHSLREFTEQPPCTALRC